MALTHEGVGSTPTEPTTFAQRYIKAWEDLFASDCWKRFNSQWDINLMFGDKTGIPKSMWMRAMMPGENPDDYRGKS